MRGLYIKGKALLNIGRRRENLATQVIYDGYPEEGYSVQVFVKRNGDSTAYPASNVELDSTGRVIRWNVTSTDTDKQGTGEVQFRYTNQAGVVVKTEIYSFIVTAAIDVDAGPAPDPYETWLDSLTELAGQAQVAAREAESEATRAATYAEQAEASAGAAAESAEEASQSEQTTKTYLDTMTEQVMPAFQQIAQSTINAADAASNSAVQAQVSSERAVTAQMAAAGSASTASTKASEASASATSASGSASTATTKASEAAQSATDAWTAARGAETYSEQAATYATSANQSKQAAEGYADSASQSAQTATTKASEAAASVNVATAKASEASASATAAQEARTGAESAAQTAQAGADAVGLLREQIYNSYPNVEAEAGSIVSITDGADGIPVKSLVVGIEPVQAGSGDPSPDNVRPITGWTGCEVVRTGKNLLPFDEVFEEGWTNTLNGITATYSNGRMKVTGTNTSSGWVNIVFYREVWARNPYHFGAGTYIMPDHLTVTASIDGGSFTNKGTVCTVQESMRVRGFYISVSPEYSVNWDIPLMFVCGSTRPADYEPYQGETYDITFPSEAGTVYGGSLDVTTGVLTVTDAQIASYAGETLPGEWISDRDVYVAGTTPTTGAQVVYKLATPITYQLTPTEIRSLLGTNNVWADTGDTSLAYRADTKLYIDGVYEEYQDDLADYADALAALG